VDQHLGPITKVVIVCVDLQRTASGVAGTAKGSAVRFHPVQEPVVIAIGIKRIGSGVTGEIIESAVIRFHPVDEAVFVVTVELTPVDDMVCDIVLVVKLEVIDEDIVEDDDAVAVLVEFVMVL
jgi:hypothetical protein